MNEQENMDLSKDKSFAESVKEEPQSKNTPESFMAQYELPKAKDFSENSKDMADKKSLDIGMDKDRD